VLSDAVEDALNGDLTPQTVANQFQGAAYIAANKQDIQQATGAFGDTDQFSADELKALGMSRPGWIHLLGRPRRRRTTRL
jgi:hypothetical protein